MPSGHSRHFLRIYKAVHAMKTSLRGRPRLDIPTNTIISTVRRFGQITAAARELGCSGAYIHQRFKAEGLSLRIVLAGGFTGQENRDDP